MHVVEYFAKEWNVIAQAPVTFLVALLLALGAAYAAASWRFGGIIESQRAQIELLARKVSAQPGGVDFERRRVIIDRLGAFLGQGTELMTACRKRDEPPPKDAASEWVTQLLKYLQTELGPAYVARANDGSSAPVGYSSQYVEHDEIYHGIRVRVFHLQEFLKELARD